MTKRLWIGLGLLSAFAAPAFAQDSASQQRMENSLRALDQLQVDQRLNELDNRVFTIEQQRRTEANFRALEDQARRAPVIEPVPIIIVPPRDTPPAKRPTASEQAMAASAERLRQISEEMKN